MIARKKTHAKNPRQIPQNTSITIPKPQQPETDPTLRNIQKLRTITQNEFL